jgi:hypothetical protein
VAILQRLKLALVTLWTLPIEVSLLMMQLKIMALRMLQAFDFQTLLLPINLQAAALPPLPSQINRLSTRLEEWLSWRYRILQCNWDALFLNGVKKKRKENK